MAKTDPLQAKEFLTAHMAKAEREMGRLPATERNDRLAQSILIDLDAKPQAQRKSEPVSAVSADASSDVVVETLTEEQTIARRKARREFWRKVFENQELYLKLRALRRLKAFPEYKPDFQRVAYWKVSYPLMATDKEAAQLKGTIEAAKIIERLLGEHQKRFGRPWYFIRKGDRWVDPKEVIKATA